jgi:hypothetical protein
VEFADDVALPVFLDADLLDAPHALVVGGRTCRPRGPAREPPGSRA